jgi:hypothetical protein
MTSRSSPLIFIALLLLFAGLGRPQLHCQDSKAPDKVDAVSAQTEFLRAAEAEQKKGTYIFYTQSFIDKENQKAIYRGSIYGALKSVELHGCSLKVGIEIVDKFSGFVGKKPTGDLADSQQYSFSLTLTTDVAKTLSLVEARPIQLSSSTRSVCAEKPSCAFTWLAIQATGPSIKESRITNEAVDFNGRADRFLIPVSSADAGHQLIGLIQNFANASCKSSTAPIK